MENKCTKYEALFTFGNEDSLKEHLAVCEDCQNEAVQAEVTDENDNQSEAGVEAEISIQQDDELEKEKESPSLKSVSSSTIKIFAISQTTFYYLVCQLAFLNVNARGSSFDFHIQSLSNNF